MTYGLTTLRNAALRHIPIKVSGIYKITNTLDGKFYIGSAVDLRRRVRHHLIMLRHGNHSSRHLQRAWNRDGEPAFKFDVLEIVEREQLYEREQCWLDETRCFEDAIGYNICRIVELPPSASPSPEHRAATSARFKGIPKSEEHRRKISEAQKGRVIDKQAIEKTRVSLKEYWSDPDNRSAQSARKKGCKAHNKGKHLSPEHKAKLSELRRVYLSDPENLKREVAKLAGHSGWNKGVPMKDTAKKKLSEAAKLRLQDPIARQQLREYAKQGSIAGNNPEANAKRSAKVANRPNEGNRKYSDAAVASWKVMLDSGMSYQKIAAEVGVNIATVHYRINKTYKQEHLWQ